MHQPLELHSFEGSARKLRYRALARACAQHDITNLLLAHHEDDVAETVIRRISQRHHSRALAGLKTRAQLPECEGEYGIYQSGSPKFFESVGRPRSLFAFESGGLFAVRPLLAFSKQQLIDTCEAEAVPWVEDTTNHDPTFTERNAIRSMVATAQLPAALSTPRILHMTTQIQKQVQQIDQLRDEYLSRCFIDSFDIRTGALRIFLPPFEDVFPAHIRDPVRYDICTQTLRHILRMVSPKSRIQPSASAVLPIFNDFPRLGRARLQSAVTVAGVTIRPVAMDIELNKRQRRARRKQESTLQPSHALERLQLAESCGFSLWQFCRQTPHRVMDQQPPAIHFPPATPDSGVDEAFELTHWRPGLRFISPGPTGFALWDGRYWIRLEPRNVSHGLVIMRMEPNELDAFVNAFDTASFGGEWQHSADLDRLSEVCASDTVGAVPAVVAPAGVPGVAAGSILALPTFRLTHPAYKDRFTWTLRYKEIDLGPLPLVSERFRPWSLSSPLSVVARIAKQYGVKGNATALEIMERMKHGAAPRQLPSAWQAQDLHRAVPQSLQHEGLEYREPTPPPPIRRFVPEEESRRRPRT